MTPYLVLVLISGMIATVTLRIVMPRLRAQGIVGRDMHKADQPRIPEMGGLAIVAGFCISMLIVIGLNTFLGWYQGVNVEELLAVLVTVLLIGLIGIMDDLIAVGQWFKALSPVFAALPLMVIQTGDTVLNIPMLGFTDVGWVYPLLLVPIGMTGASNAVNMLAGFNGLEVGLGTVMFASLAVIAFSWNEWTSAAMLTAAAGATLACMYYNWFPAKVFVGDVGTLTMGAILASAVIIGDFELAGALLVVPHLVDFTIKIFHRFPKTFGVFKDGKLYCPPEGPAGLGQLLMKLFGGLHERNLTLMLMGVELLLGWIAIGLYARL